MVDDHQGCGKGREGIDIAKNAGAKLIVPHEPTHDPANPSRPPEKGRLLPLEGLVKFLSSRDDPDVKFAHIDRNMIHVVPFFVS